jgi:chromosome segregation ATPase
MVATKQEQTLTDLRSTEEQLQKQEEQLKVSERTLGFLMQQNAELGQIETDCKSSIEESLTEINTIESLASENVQQLGVVTAKFNNLKQNLSDVKDDIEWKRRSIEALKNKFVEVRVNK